MGADARVAIFSQGNPPNKVRAAFIFDGLTPFIQQPSSCGSGFLKRLSQVGASQPIATALTGKMAHYAPSLRRMFVQAFISRVQP